MKTKYYKIKPGKYQLWKDWCTEIAGKLRDVAEETLAEENLVSETCLIIGQDFVIYDHEEALGKLKEPMNLDKEINRKHRELVRECLEPISSDLGYHLIAKK